MYRLAEVQIQNHLAKHARHHVLRNSSILFTKNDGLPLCEGALDPWENPKDRQVDFGAISIRAP
jgi:hypothetical protein